MRSLWQRIVQGIFGKPYSLQGDWLGREEFDLEDWECELCEEYDILEE